MAVTYAWRLDSDKFAYIVSPSGVNGYVSEVQLTGSDLKRVAETAENRFGNGGSYGLSGYTQAFIEMERKIATKWPNLEYADMLSADMYYNVDAQNCADLRGVGIKGTMYLGSLPNPEDGGIEPTNVSYYASGASVNNVTILPGLPGYTDIYGIYLTDQIENENDVVSAATSAPEYMFVVRNGKDGADGTENGEGGELIEKLQKEFRELIEKLQKDIDALDSRVSSIEKEVAELSASIGDMKKLIDEKGYDTIINNITDLQKNVKTINEKITKLQPGTGGGSTGGGGSNGGGSISVKSIAGINYGGYYLLASASSGNKLTEVYTLDYAVANRAGIAIGSNDVQVQILSGGTLQSTDEIYAKNGFYQTQTNNPDLPPLE